MIYIIYGCPTCNPQSAAEELLDVIETGFAGYECKKGCWHPPVEPQTLRPTENQMQGLQAASLLYFAPIGFKFQALVERWSMEELVSRLRSEECTRGDTAESIQ